MTDGSLLLKAVLRTNAREDSAVAALVDFLQDHVPAPGANLCIETRLVVRKGLVSAYWIPLVRSAQTIRFEMHHFGGRRGHRSKVCYTVPSADDFGSALARLVTVYRS